MNCNCSDDVLGMRNLQEQVKKAFSYQKLFWPFTFWINCSSHLKIFENSWPSALNFKRFSRSLEQFFLKVGQNNFVNKIPIYIFSAEHGFFQDSDFVVTLFHHFNGYHQSWSLWVYRCVTKNPFIKSFSLDLEVPKD